MYSFGVYRDISLVSKIVPERQKSLLNKGFFGAHPYLFLPKMLDKSALVCYNDNIIVK